MFAINPINIDTLHRGSEFYVDLETVKTHVPFSAKVDTGAQANIMPHQVYKLFTKSRLHTSEACLQGYSGTQLHNLDIARVSCITKSNPTSIMVDFYVTKGGKHH